MKPDYRDTVSTPLPPLTGPLLDLHRQLGRVIPEILTVVETIQNRSEALEGLPLTLIVAPPGAPATSEHNSHLIFEAATPDDRLRIELTRGVRILRGAALAAAEADAAAEFSAGDREAGLATSPAEAEELADQFVADLSEQLSSDLSSPLSAAFALRSALGYDGGYYHTRFVDKRGEYGVKEQDACRTVILEQLSNSDGSPGPRQLAGKLDENTWYLMNIETMEITRRVAPPESGEVTSSTLLHPSPVEAERIRNDCLELHRALLLLRDSRPVP